MVLTINMKLFEKISLKITIINPYKIILRRTIIRIENCYDYTIIKTNFVVFKYKY
jgi:hypothetical protein